MEEKEHQVNVCGADLLLARLRPPHAKSIAEVAVLKMTERIDSLSSRPTPVPVAGTLFSCAHQDTRRRTQCKRKIGPAEGVEDRF